MKPWKPAQSDSHLRLYGSLNYLQGLPIWSEHEMSIGAIVEFKNTPQQIHNGFDPRWMATESQIESFLKNGEH